jgi:hypothetical protein
MAYSCKIHGTWADASNAVFELRKKLLADGRFVVTLSDIDKDYRKPRDGSRKEGYTFMLKPVRLAKHKEYCGQHPGVCQVNTVFGERKKMKATYLEWDDWVGLHDLVNDLLDELRMDADVWSTPMECKGKMWIRKGTRRRIKWEWTEGVPNAYGLSVRTWNNGTEDQFAKEAPLAVHDQARSHHHG